MMNSTTILPQESALSKALRDWEADPQGKCGSCQYAQGFDNQWEADKSITDTCVRCTNRDKALLTDLEEMQGRHYQRLLETQGYFRIFRVESMGRFYCRCWRGK